MAIVHGRVGGAGELGNIAEVHRLQLKDEYDMEPHHKHSDYSQQHYIFHSC